MFTVVLFWLVVVVALAIGVALFAAFARDLNQRVNQAHSGGENLAKRLEEIQARQAELVERIQNLETIIASDE